MAASLLQCSSANYVSYSFYSEIKIKTSEYVVIWIFIISMLLSLQYRAPSQLVNVSSQFPSVVGKIITLFHI